MSLSGNPQPAYRLAQRGRIDLEQEWECYLRNDQAIAMYE